MAQLVITSRLCHGGANMATFSKLLKYRPVQHHLTCAACNTIHTHTHTEHSTQRCHLCLLEQNLPFISNQCFLLSCLWLQGSQRGRKLYIHSSCGLPDPAHTHSDSVTGHCWSPPCSLHPSYAPAVCCRTLSPSDAGWAARSQWARAAWRGSEALAVVWCHAGPGYYLQMTSAWAADAFLATGAGVREGREQRVQQ